MKIREELCRLRSDSMLCGKHDFVEDYYYPYYSANGLVFVCGEKFTHKEFRRNFSLICESKAKEFIKDNINEKLKDLKTYADHNVSVVENLHYARDVNTPNIDKDFLVGEEGYRPNPYSRKWLSTAVKKFSKHFVKEENVDKFESANTTLIIYDEPINMDKECLAHDERTLSLEKLKHLKEMLNSATPREVFDFCNVFDRYTFRYSTATGKIHIDFTKD